jgi:hypothetical protein
VFTSAMLFFAFFLYRFCTKKRICAKSTLENWTCGAAPGGQRAATGCTTRARNAAMGVPTIVLSRESRGGSRRARPPCARGRSAACQTSQLNLPPAACRQPPLAEHKRLRPNTTTTTQERAPRALPWAAAEDQRRLSSATTSWILKIFSRKVAPAAAGGAEILSGPGFDEVQNTAVF